MSKHSVLLFVFCLFFTCRGVPDASADEAAAWSDIWGTLFGTVSNIAHDDLQKLPKLEMGIITGSGTSRTVLLGASEFLDIYKMVTKAADGDFEGARDQAISTSAGYFMPLLGTALSIQGAAKTAISAKIENWSEDLYSTEAYRLILHEVNRLVNAPFHSDARPYLPSMMMKDATLKKDMEAMEWRYYENTWQHSHAVTIDLRTGGNPARIRQIIGKEPRNTKPVFHLFLKEVVRTQGKELKFRYEKALAAHAEKVKKQLKAQAEKAMKKALVKLAPPRELEVQGRSSSGRFEVTYVFKGSPITTYTSNISLEKNGKYISEAVYKDLKTREGMVRETGYLPLPKDGTYDLILIAQSGYGNSESLRVPVTIVTSKEPVIKGHLGTYAGPDLPSGGAVQNGQILAFTADMNHPDSSSGILSSVSWHVEKKKGGKIPGIEKTEQVYEKGGITSYRFRFVLDQVEDGDYRVVFTYQVPSRPELEQSATFPVSVQQAVTIKRVLATPDKTSQTHHRVIFVDESPLLYAHYTLAQGIDTVTATLTAKDEATGRILDQITTERPRKPDMVQRVGMQADMSRFRDGQKILFSARIQTPDGRFAEDTASFRIKGYTMKLDFPDTMRARQKAKVMLDYPMGFEKPLKIQCRSDSSFLAIRNKEDSIHAVLDAGEVKGRKKATITVQVTDAKGRTARASKTIMLIGPKK